MDYYYSNRHFMRTIRRIRTHHVQTPEYKGKFVLQESQNCICRELEMLQHLILDGPSIDYERRL